MRATQAALAAAGAGRSTAPATERARRMASTRARLQARWRPDRLPITPTFALFRKFRPSAKRGPSRRVGLRGFFVAIMSAVLRFAYPWDRQMKLEMVCAPRTVIVFRGWTGPIVTIS